MSFIIGHEWDGKRKFWQMLEWSHTSFLTADTRGTDCRCLQYRGDRITERQFFSSWFTSFSCILTTPCVGYHACKSIESVVFCLNNIPQISPPPLYRAFSLTWPVSMQIYWNKRKCLHKKRVQLPRDWFGTPTWLPFHCFGKPIWPPWRHVKTLYYDVIKLHLLWSSTKNQ